MVEIIRRENVIAGNFFQGRYPLVELDELPLIEGEPGEGYALHNEGQVEGLQDPLQR